VKTVALLTDFGLRDAYAGVMTGVILAGSPTSRVVDLSHGVPPQDVRMGAFTLMSAFSYFPRGTIFVCVVDPGVGTKRSILWARTAHYQFVAPDNGLISWVAQEAKFLEVRRVTEDAPHLPKVSRTFHGRDIFAPVAAGLAEGLAPALLGPEVEEIVELPFPSPRKSKGGIKGEVIAVDGFGNAITNFTKKDVGAKTLSVKERKVGKIVESYASVGIGRPCAVVGSSGFVEMSLREGNFSAEYGVYEGETVYGG
jgi:hypothetical protein